MNRFSRGRGARILLLTYCFCASLAMAADQVVTESGKVQGVISGDHSVRIFKGIPFAAAPVGALRWKAPQPAPGWTAVRQAEKFGSPCVQTDVFGDIYFRDSK